MDMNILKKSWKKNWKLFLLLNQFHDILPGSSIKDVYEDSAVQYERNPSDQPEELQKGQEKAILSSLKENGNNKEGLAVFNPFGFRRTSAAELSAEEARWAEKWSERCPEGMIIQRTGEGGMLILVKDAPSKGLGVYENSVFDIQAEEPVIRSLVTDERGLAHQSGYTPFSIWNLTHRERSAHTGSERIQRAVKKKVLWEMSLLYMRTVPWSLMPGILTLDTEKRNGNSEELRSFTWKKTGL